MKAKYMQDSPCDANSQATIKENNFLMNKCLYKFYVKKFKINSFKTFLYHPSKKSNHFLAILIV